MPTWSVKWISIPEPFLPTKAIHSARCLTSNCVTATWNAIHSRRHWVPRRYLYHLTDILAKRLPIWFQYGSLTSNSCSICWAYHFCLHLQMRNSNWKPVSIRLTNWLYWGLAASTTWNWTRNSTEKKPNISSAIYLKFSRKPSHWERYTVIMPEPM